MPLLRQLAMFWLVAGCAVHPSLGADVLLTNGKTLEVTAYVVAGETLRLTFPGGGEVTLPLSRVRAIHPAEMAPPGLLAMATGEPAPDDAPPAGAAGGVALTTLSDPDAGGNSGTNIDALIETLAAEYGVSPRLIRAVIEAESGWNPRAVSRTGAAGLMQLMPGTARGRGVTDPFDPEQNLGAGVAELAEHLRHYSGEMSMALAAYNAGGRAVARHEGIPPYLETIHYVRRVLDRYFTAADLPPLGTRTP